MTSSLASETKALDSSISSLTSSSGIKFFKESQSPYSTEPISEILFEFLFSKSSLSILSNKISFLPSASRPYA